MYNKLVYQKRVGYTGWSIKRPQFKCLLLIRTAHKICCIILRTSTPRLCKKMEYLDRCHTCDFVARLCRTSARQSRATKSQV